MKTFLCEQQYFTCPFISVETATALHPESDRGGRVLKQSCDPDNQQIFQEKSAGPNAGLPTKKIMVKSPFEYILLSQKI